MTSACWAAARLSVPTLMPNCAESAKCTIGMLDGGDQLFGEQEIVLEEGLQQDAAHLACAENGDAKVGQNRRGDWKFVAVIAHSIRLPESELRAERELS
jgi:hypothetical protein